MNLTHNFNGIANGTWYIPYLKKTSLYGVNSNSTAQYVILFMVRDYHQLLSRNNMLQTIISKMRELSINYYDQTTI